MSLENEMYEKLMNSIDPSGTKFLMCRAARDWDWPVAEKGCIQEQAYALIGYLPQAVEDGKPYFTPSDKDVFQAYSSVINAVSPSSSDAYDQAVKDVEQKITAARRKLGDDRDSMNEEMKEEKNNEGFDKESWMKDMGWDGVLAGDRESLAKYNAELSEIVKKWNPDHAAALKAIAEDPTMERKGFVKMHTAGKFEVYPNFLVGVDGIDWARKARLGKAGGSKGFDLSISSMDLKESESKVGFEAGLKLFFLKVFGVKGKAERSTMETEVKKMTVSINFKAHTTVDVHADPGWYNSSYLAKVFNDDRWKEPSDTKEKIFGKEGFHSIITGFVAVFQPSITIKMSESAMKKAKFALEGSIDIDVPPFTAGGIPGISASAEAKGSRSQSSLSSRIEGNSITIESKSDFPQILGVYVSPPGGVKV